MKEWFLENQKAAVSLEAEECGDWDVAGPEANYLSWASSKPRMNHPEPTLCRKIL